MDSALLRMVDANANRSREAIRVMEDCARFVLNDPVLVERIKRARHELRDILAPWHDDAVLWRDTPGDVGRSVKAADELHRSDSRSIVLANAKRVGEALRVLEEVLKTESPVAAARVEALRYQCYEVERLLAVRLRCRDWSKVRLYVLLTESLCQHHWFDTAKWLVDAGVHCIQLREPTMESRCLLDRASRLVALCQPAGVVTIINDRPDIAILSGADGVHAGQGDIPAAVIRKFVGAGRAVGVSTHTIEQVAKAKEDGADYVGVGPVYPSTTKRRDFLPGLAFAREAARADLLPGFAIGGIGAENLGEVLATGIGRVAVCSAIIGQANVAGAAGKFLKAMTSPPAESC